MRQFTCLFGRCVCSAGLCFSDAGWKGACLGMGRMLPATVARHISGQQPLSRCVLRTSVLDSTLHFSATGHRGAAGPEWNSTLHRVPVGCLMVPLHVPLCTPLS